MTPFPRQELRAWLASITGLGTAVLPAPLSPYQDAIVFADEPEAMTTGPGRLRITMTTNDAASLEDVWSDADQPAPAGAAKVTTRELDYITLGLVYELQAPATTNFPADPLRRIRAKGQQLAFLQALHAIGLSLIDTGPIRAMSARDSEGRAIPYAQMDLRVGFYSEDVVQPTEMATDFVQKATVAIDVADKPYTVNVTAGS